MKAPWQYLEDLLWPSDKLLCSNITFVLSLSAFFLGSADFPNCLPQRLYGVFVFITFSFEPLLYTSSKQGTNHANQYPVCNYGKYWSVVRYWYGSSSLRGHLLKMITLKGDGCLCCVTEQKSFTSVSRIRLRLIRWTGHCIFVSMVRRCPKITAGCRSRHPRLTLDHRLCRHMLAHRHQGLGLLSQFSPFRYFPHFPLLSKQTLATEYHVYIWQVSPVKYECDSWNLTGAFARSKILLTEKLANGALVTPTPGLEPPALVTCDICWRVHSQPPQL